MNTIAKVATAAAIVLGTASLAQAQSAYAPQVPNPANPAPYNPIATDGSPLPPYAVPAEPRVYSGRSAAFDDGLGGFVGAPLGFAGDTAGAALGTAGSVVDGTVGATGRFVDGR